MKTTFWSTANKAFSQAERNAYNRFRIELYLEADRLRDRMSMDDPAMAHARDLMEMICTMPMMER
ncbi:hypothetical protein [Thioalkalivibrio thiocyanodenitrificans]|uniref:hypothetical protein n=1 Tax=Thioalkalivibrio thiocyanodenitrificans TaxID=243063 RepID=UPI0003624A73|nr:hypothetical protein [Thioalkalivibrio thiocyanodenitrificans]